MSKIDQQNGESQGDYCLLAQSMRASIAQYMLAQSTDVLGSSTLCKKGKTPLTLTVLTQTRASQIEVTAFTLSNPDKSIGIMGVWHHGVEEVFYIQRVQDQLLCRSLRHQNDDTIARGLHWLRTHLGELGDYCLCPKML